MAASNLTEVELKKNIEIVILESYSKAKIKKFQELNYVFPSNKSVISFLKDKLKIFNSLDIYSQTFLSIHTKAKIVLREFQSQKFNYEYLELLRLVLTLPSELLSGKFKSAGIREKENIEITELKEIKEEVIINDKLKEKTKIVKEGITGRDIKKTTRKFDLLIKEINVLDFEDTEYKNKSNVIDDLKL